MVEFNQLSSLEPNGSDETLLVRDGQPFRSTLTAVLDTRFAVANGLQCAVFEERRNSGDNGGLLQPNQWGKRNLNHKQGTLGTLLNGVISLPPGNYLFSGYSSTLETSSSRCRLVSTDLTYNIPGLSCWANHYTNLSFVQGVINLESPKDFQLQHRWHPDTLSDGTTRPSKSWNLGYRTGFDGPEVYASLLFIQF
ncbi:hypothetical protein IQ260_19635 [Leptolyngbya cf. ectocarpi LEGE 11479]|uniref:Uncharacterized protein n=1 Tax=Leptolyngbya cf. ectocarpi LEGE 11479 TaxID=1828722 RepID=A0A928ZWR9_LEPEC|nr:hypothetical protein [Leptolyngbya ectocarpi]MBE9068860.1 hypothetical protein [Leptolyngbya cf. ectocarpi LEGE 11479]